MSKYSFSQGVIKSLKYVVVFAVAMLVTGLQPEIKELTVGGILVLLLNFIKVQWDIKFL